MALIDVIIPTYNYGKFLRGCLGSVVGQTISDVAVFVIDDGSNDNTHEIVSEYGSRYANVHYFFQNNKGLPAARNTGIRLGVSPFVAFLDSDDLWMPQKLEETLNPFLIKPSLGVVYSLVELVDESGNQIRPARPFIPVRGNVYRQLVMKNHIVGSASSVLLRRECLERVGYFDESLPSCEDWDLWLRISRYFPFEYVAEPLVKIRIHQGNMHKDTERMVKGKLAVINKALSMSMSEDSPLKTTILANVFITVSHHYMERGVHNKSVRFAIKALFQKPFFAIRHPSFVELIRMFLRDTFSSMKERLKRLARTLIFMGPK